MAEERCWHANRGQRGWRRGAVVKIDVNKGAVVQIEVNEGAAMQIEMNDSGGGVPSCKLR